MAEKMQANLRRLQQNEAFDTGDAPLAADGPPCRRACLLWPTAAHGRAARRTTHAHGHATGGPPPPRVRHRGCRLAGRRCPWARRQRCQPVPRQERIATRAAAWAALPALVCRLARSARVSGPSSRGVRVIGFRPAWRRASCPTRRSPARWRTAARAAQAASGEEAMCCGRSCARRASSSSTRRSRPCGRAPTAAPASSSSTRRARRCCRPGPASSSNCSRATTSVR